MRKTRVLLQLVSTLAISFIIFVLILACIVSCRTNTDKPGLKIDLPEETHVEGLAGPIRLNIDSTIIYLSDYFNDLEAVESVSINAEGVEARLTGDGAILILSTPAMPAIVGLEVVVDGFPRTLVCRKSRLRKYTFSFDAKGKTYGTVQMKGEMNAWNVNAQELVLNDSVYSTELVLEPKRYQYIMVLDGKEVIDRNNPDSVSNGMGGFNSLLKPFEDQAQEPLHLSTISSGEGKIGLKASSHPDAVIVLWENFQIPAKTESGHISFEIPAGAANVERSHIRVFASVGDAVSNDVLIPLHRSKVLISADSLNRMDKHAMVLYNVFVDRFFNGDTLNDRPLNRPDVHPRADYHGGDILGATQIIEKGYFDELGVNTIWISPVVKNVEGAFGFWPDPSTKFSAYHGYWPVSFSRVDDRMGTAEDLHELVDAAHERDMNLLLDFVAHHVHEEHPFYKANKKAATDLYLPDGRLNTELWDEQRLTTWFDVFLPSLRLDDPYVYETLSDSAVYWIKEYGLDGFRHDATKHVPEIFWRTLTRKLKDEVTIPENREIYQIGETYGTRELVASYVNAGQLDAQFDFNVYDACVSALARPDGSFLELNDAIQASLDMFGHHHLMGNITGNQDRGRFISYAGGALRFDENAKEAGWTREVGVGDPSAYMKSAMLMAVIATIPGLPVIYYGDEVGFFGGNDPDNRKMMVFEGLTGDQTQLLEKTRKIFNFRKGSLALMYGDMRVHHCDKDTYAFTRNYFDQRALVVFNRSDEPRQIELELEEGLDVAGAAAAFGTPFTGEKNKISISLEGYGYEIITLK